MNSCDISDDAPRIWIGGAGRSGTSLLSRLIGEHPEVYGLPYEMRFLIDSGGLVDLVHSLTSGYSPVTSREALKTFKHLLLREMNTPRYSPYYSYRLSDLLGGDYENDVNDYVNKLSYGSFVGWDLPTHLSPGRDLLRYIGGHRYFRKVVPVNIANKIMDRGNTEHFVVKYFENKDELYKLSGDFVDALFLRPMKTNKSGARTWAEKTPHNLLYADILTNILPNSVFIHIYRDPRGVAQSYVRQKWAPSDLRLACKVIRDIYMRWKQVKENVDGSRLIEVKLEDLSESPLEVYNKILLRSGLSQISEVPIHIKSEKVNYWRETMSSSEIELMTSELQDVLEFLGYEC